MESSSSLNLMIFYLYAVVGNFAVKSAHNFIGSFFPVNLPLKSFASVMTIVVQIRIVTQWWVWRVIFLVFPMRFLLIALLFLWFTWIGVIQLIKIFSIYDNDGSGSGSTDMSVGGASWSVGSVSGVSFGGFVPTGIKSLGDVVLWVVFVPRGVDSKGGWLIGSFWRPKSWSTNLSLLVSNSYFF